MTTDLFTGFGMQVWWFQLTAVDRPALPGGWVAQWWQHLGWAMVLAAVLAWVSRPLRAHVRCGMVLAMVLWCALPGGYSPTFWLGLAFQSPSVSSGGVAAWVLWHCAWPALRGRGHSGGVAADLPGPRLGLGAGLGIALGWVLLADTLALLPVSVYAWGFSPLTTAVVLGVIFLPWVWQTSYGAGRQAALVAGAWLVGFVLLRLPSGNVWDAVLDPWLWVALQGYALRAVWRHRRIETPIVTTKAGL